MKARYRAVFWSSVIASVFVHMAVFAFWPTMHASDFTFAAEELTAVELPPEIEIPPPPQQVARPATPVIAAAALEEDVTIAPTTFEDNPVEELPPPPEIGNASDAAAGPSFTPFTVAPRILNGEEIAGVMRLEYPPLLRDAGIGGEVVVWFYIDERGQLQGTRLFQSSGHEELDEAALRVADRIRFSPALNGDRNVPVWIQFPLTFRVR
jgi:protein TonB